MEFFYATEKSKFRIIDKKKLAIDVKLIDLDNASVLNYQEHPEKLYFTTDEIFKIVKHFSKQFKKEHTLVLISEKEQIYEKYLAQKDILNSQEKIEVSEELKIAVIFDIKPFFDSEFKIAVINEFKYFYENLASNYKNVQIDVFTIYFSEWIDLVENIPITNLYLIPETVEKLSSYDAYIMFSELVDSQNLVDKSKIDVCLRRLNIENLKTDIKVIKHEDLVSIIIPTYNRENYIQEAVNSVLNQTHKNFELIIVDDGSIDNTRSIIEHKYLLDKRVKYIYQENTGISASRNKGIAEAKGKYLMFLDDDDIYLPYTVEKLLSFLKNKPENIKLVYGDVINFIGSNKLFLREKDVVAKPELYFKYLEGNNFTTPGQVIIETQVVKDVGMFDSNFKNASDYQLWTKIIYKYDIAKIDLPVTLYRKHDSQQTSTEGNIRYYSDTTALKLWYRFVFNKPELLDIPYDYTLSVLDQKIDLIAMNAYQYYFSHYDTALEILKFAQEKKFDPDREVFINYLNENIPILIKEKFNSELRITDEHKEILKQQAKMP